jgi:hypothetical protein
VGVEPLVLVAIVGCAGIAAYAAEPVIPPPRPSATLRVIDAPTARVSDDR